MRSMRSQLLHKGTAAAKISGDMETKMAAADNNFKSLIWTRPVGKIAAPKFQPSLCHIKPY